MKFELGNNRKKEMKNKRNIQANTRWRMKKNKGKVKGGRN